MQDRRHEHQITRAKLGHTVSEDGRCMSEMKEQQDLCQQTQGSHCKGKNKGMPSAPRYQ